MKGKIDFIPPTYRPVKAIYEEVDARIKALIEKNDDDLVTVEDLLIFASAMSEHLLGEDRKTATAFIASSLVNVEILLNRHPESKSLIMSSATNLILAGLRSVEDLIIKQSSAEMKKTRPLLEVNKQKEAAIERAKNIATEKWAIDSAEKVKISAMADKVYRALADEGYSDQLPGTSDQIKDWISSVAPSYARKGGRPPKTP